MDRRILLVILGLSTSLLGCQTQNGATWPNLFAGSGPQRIPPPATHTISTSNTPASGTYYPEAPQSAAPIEAAPLVQSTLPVSPTLTPPSPVRTISTSATDDETYWRRRNGPIGSGVRVSSPSTSLQIAANESVIHAEPSIRIEPSNDSGSVQPSAFRPPSEARLLDTRTDIVRSEPERGALPVRGFQARQGESTAIVIQPETTSLPNTAATTAPALIDASAVPRYGYAPDYRSLSGRLEYSQTERRWKLRYIPHDAPIGQIDSYGGSVSLENTEKLSGYAAGDFVVVRGQMGEASAEGIDYAPTFRVDQVIRTR